MKRPLVASIAALIGVAGSVSGLLGSRAGASNLASPPPAVVAPPVPVEEPASAPDPEPAASTEPASAPVVDGPPSISVDPPAAEKTRAPKRGAWVGAQPVKLTRSNLAGCKARRIREWVRIDCEISGVDSISLIAGTREGVELWTTQNEPWTAVLILPLRRGDRRVFQINESAGKYGVSPSAIVSEEWVEGEDAPAITIQRV